MKIKEYMVIRWVIGIFYFLGPLIESLTVASRFMSMVVQVCSLLYILAMNKSCVLSVTWTSKV